jgi:hypothetical protein
MMYLGKARMSWQNHDLRLHPGFDSGFTRSKVLPSAKLCSDDAGSARMSWLFHDPGFNSGKARASWWLCHHDVGFAHTSDGRFATTSWLCHDVGFAHTSSGL